MFRVAPEIWIVCNLDCAITDSHDAGLAGNAEPGGLGVDLIDHSEGQQAPVFKHAIIMTLQPPHPLGEFVLGLSGSC